jgi:glycosyltransferase involved in cell wall biosynthesis
MECSMYSKSNLKVLLYHRAITNVGGAEKLLIKELINLRKLGAITYILTFKYKKEALFNNPQWILIIPTKNRSLEFSLSLKYFFTRIKEIALLIVWLNNLKPDLVRCNYGHIELFLASMVTKIPYVLQRPSPPLYNDDVCYALIHKIAMKYLWGSNPWHFDLVPRYKKLGLVRRLLIEVYSILDFLSIRKAKAIFVHTPLTAREFMVFYRRTPISLIGAFDEEKLNRKSRYDLRKELGIEKNVKIILNVNRLHKIKKIDLLIKAFQKVERVMPNTVLLIVGDGPERENLIKLSRVLRISEKVLFLGSVDEEKLWDLYTCCDLFVSAASADILLTPFEAIACGKPVVCTPEISSAINIKSMVYPAEAKVEAFASAMLKALNEERRHVPQEEIKKYAWENYFRKIYNIYFNIVYKK